MIIFGRCFQNKLVGTGFLTHFEGAREECGRDSSPGCRGISFSVDFRACFSWAGSHQGDALGTRLSPGRRAEPCAVPPGHGGGCPPRCRSWWDSRSSGCQANADILPALFGYSFNNPPPPAAPSSQPSAGGVSTAQQNPRLSCSRLQAPKSCWKFIFLLNIQMRSLKCRQVV